MPDCCGAFEELISVPFTAVRPLGRALLSTRTTQRSSSTMEIPDAAFGGTRFNDQRCRKTLRSTSRATITTI